MARVSATASLGMKIGLGHKAGYTQYDSASPHHSFTIEKDYPSDTPEDELVSEAERLHGLARKLVEREINNDAKDLNEGKPTAK